MINVPLAALTLKLLVFIFLMYMQLVISHYMSLGDTASNLGSAVDELMRHQPTLKTDATTAIIKVLLFIYF